MFYSYKVLFGLSVTLSLAPIVQANAQLIPDNTLGKENSIVTPTKLLQRIDGGAIRGSNLFHSFKEFNIDKGKSVYFNNPSAIENILTRVTGKNPSNIFGKLGVLGNANLFLLNPNGIIFDKDASLDISGSFTGTTSSSILFQNGFEFSAINPNHAPLLKINLTPGLQYPQNQQGDIINQGNLTVRGDLNLIGKNLDLTGKLNSGSDIKLQAEDTLKIRDRLTSPLIINAGRDLLLQGNQQIDIFALNHSDSGLYSGNDLVLQSSNPVLGDAHYFSGGNFRIEKLDGNFGDLTSPNDPIIRANGDVSFDSYTGASLHILAGGSVNIAGNVTITGADGENGLQEMVTLSNGESLEIDGKNQATLDIRAGTIAFGTPGVTQMPYIIVYESFVTSSGEVISKEILQPLNIFIPEIPKTEESRSGSDIVIGGNIKVNSAEGLVFLSNQYQSNTSLSRGDIRVKNIIRANESRGNGGRIVIDSKGDISTQDLDSSSSSSSFFGDSGNGGAITLDADGNITTQSLNSSSYGNSGDINIDASQFKLINRSVLETGAQGSGNGGNVNINAKSATIDNAIIRFGVSSNSSGDGGNLTINAENLTLSANASFEGDVSPGATGKGGNVNLNITQTLLMDGASQQVAPTGESTRITVGILSRGSGESGDVKIKAGSFIMKNGAIIKSSAQGNGIAGKINIEADTVDISGSVPLESQYFSQTRGGLPSGLFSSGDGNGKANNITVNAKNFRIADGAALSTRTTGNKAGGDIRVNATNKFTAINGGQLLTSAFNSGDAGSIFVNAPIVELSGNEEHLQTRINRINSYKGNVFEFGFVANAILDTNGNSGLFASTKKDSNANGGNIDIIADSLSLQDLAQVSVSSLANGKAGNLNIQTNNMQLNNSEISATTESGAGGNINLDGLTILSLNHSEISASTINGIAGDIEIDTTNLIQLEGASKLASEATGNGNAGNLTIYTPLFTISDNSTATVSSKGDGSAGNLSISANSINLDNQAKISAQTVFGSGGNIQLQNLKTLELNQNSQINASTADGKAGNININAKDSINLFNSSNITSEATGEGTAGELTITTGQFNINNASQASVNSKQAAGNLTVTAESIILDNQAKITSETDTGVSGNILLEELKTLQLKRDSLLSAATIDGKAGNITINASDEVKVESNSKIASGAVGKGEAGFLEIITDKLTISDNSQATVSSTQTGNSGLISIQANDVNLLENAKIFATTQSGIGDGITINDLKTLSLNNSEISASTIDGVAGNIDINVTDSIKLEADSKIASEATGNGIAGNLNITTNQFAINDNSQATVNSKGDGSAGNLSIYAEFLNLNNQAQISAQTVFGSGGNIQLQNLKTLELNQNSQINASTIDGKAGNVSIKATDSIKINSDSNLSSEATSNGNAGNLTITTPLFTISDNSQASVSSQGDGSAGNLSIAADNLNLNNQSQISAQTISGSGGNISLNNLQTLELNQNSQINASTIDGKAGNVSIKATDSIKINSDSNLSSEATSNGNAGSLNINTKQFNLTDNSQANVSSKGSGNAGNLLVNASDVNLSGNATISATTESGVGGNITLHDLNKLSVNKSEISASTVNGEAGDIKVNASESIKLTGKGGLSVQATEDGIAGSIKVTTSKFNINNEAQVTVSSRKGQAGNLKITADNLFLNQAILTAETGKSGSLEAANITLDIKNLFMLSNNSLLSAQAFENANGGNITINNDQGFIIGLPFENSDISANANQGNGGDIDITTQNIFGLVFRDKNTSKSDITASSKFGLNGEITVDQLNINPASGLVELPSTLVGTTPIKAGCAASNGNNFIVTGKGGLPQSPDDLFSGETTLTDLFDLAPTEKSSSNISNDFSNLSTDNQTSQIVEATGWIVDDEGNVIFVAKIPEYNQKDSGFNSTSCKDFSALSK